MSLAGIRNPQQQETHAPQQFIGLFDHLRPSADYYSDGCEADVYFHSK